MSANFKSCLWGRVLVDLAVLVGVVLATLLVYRIKFGEYISFITSPFLLVALVNGLITASVMDRWWAREIKPYDLWDYPRGRFALLSLVTAFALAFDIYAFISASFTIGASLISALAFAACGLSFVHLSHSYSHIATSAENRKRNDLPDAVHIICLLCIIAGLVLVQLP